MRVNVLVGDVTVGNIVDRQGQKWKVGLGLWAAQGPGGGVVGAGGVLRRVEGAEPDPGLLPRVADLGGKPAPRPLSDPPIPWLYLGRSGSDRFGCRCRRRLSSGSTHGLCLRGRPSEGMLIVRSEMVGRWVEMDVFVGIPGWPATTSFDLFSRTVTAMQEPLSGPKLEAYETPFNTHNRAFTKCVYKESSKELEF
ncbi:hypothetical protein RJ639_045178 [Escallonia herrerae]|uniref:Uncharacterized protein n=1 Tax=Escallonia herrerae TaxID=1293975 RepID=A0AA88W6V3_9ASTE|nr:hypothetical protein RJ639_045178 [Escallonia herrerae]